IKTYSNFNLPYFFQEHLIFQLPRQIFSDSSSKPLFLSSRLSHRSPVAFTFQSYQGLTTFHHPPCSLRVRTTIISHSESSTWFLCFHLAPSTFTLITGRSLRPTDQILNQLVLANCLVLFSKGIPQEMAAFGLKYFLVVAGYKLVFYFHRVARGVSLSTTCLLGGFLRGGGSWGEVRVASTYIHSLTVFLCLIVWASGSMVLVLHRHKQRVQHIHSNSLSPRGKGLSPRPSHEARATRTILILVSSFVLLYSLSSILTFCVVLSVNPALWLVNTSAFVAFMFPDSQPLRSHHP
ncbi:vomeronasal type-1 receptor 1-like, partial [Megaptera novaeangliae]